METKRIHLTASMLWLLNSNQLEEFKEKATGFDAERAQEEWYRRVPFSQAMAAIETGGHTGINLNVTPEAYAALERAWNTRMSAYLAERDRLRKKAGLD